MSISFSCHCEERKKLIHERNWEVWHRQCNYSYFETPRDKNIHQIIVLYIVDPVLRWDVPRQDMFIN